LHAYLLESTRVDSELAEAALLDDFRASGMSSVPAFLAAQPGIQIKKTGPRNLARRQARHRQTG